MDTSAQDSSQDCLCLLCRQRGHVVERCPRFVWQWEHPGTPFPPHIEPTRPSPPFSPFPASSVERSAQALCQRCNKLDALSKVVSLRPFVLEDYDGDKKMTKKATQIPSLGPVRTLRLLSTCPLCRLIFDITYLTEEEKERVDFGGELMVITGWTIYRFEQDLHWKGCAKGTGPYAKCAYTSVTHESFPKGTYCPKRLVGEAMDAIGLIDVGLGESQSDDTPPLGVRQVDPKTPDYHLIKHWLHRCDNLHHITCRPLVSDGLKQIKLIDVETRQIIMYPGNCDYIALSYVWGGVVQPSYKLGDTLPTVPATLEDAMVVTRNLGKQYLWVDSLCIDQGDDAEKAVQIGLMSAIYSGAWATIFCLSGRSARSGLPRVGTSEGVIPQLSWELWGKKLLSVMPSLPQQMSWSPWVSRAWTYQEGLLSPRRLFFTNHQVYFECNSVQCCESLDDTSSPFHIPSDEERKAVLDDVVQDPKRSIIAGPEGVIGRGVFRDPFRPISSAVDSQTDNDDFARYWRIVQTYTMKKMSHDTDSLNAFSAMLTRLQENWYKRGFVQGLPVDDLPRAMLWFHPAPSRRRVGFAAWSWAGWEGAVNKDTVHGAENSYDAIMPPLRIWRSGDGAHPELIYNFNPTPHIERPEADDTDSWEDVKDSDSDSESGYESDEFSSDDLDDDSEEIDFTDDPVFRLAKGMPEETPAIPTEINENELVIEGVVISANFAETPRDYWSENETDDEPLYEGRCFVWLEGKPKRQRLRIYGHNASEVASQRSGTRQEFLIVSREHQGTGRRVYNSLLLIDREGEVANRVGVASLRLDGVELLDYFSPERRLFKLR